MIIKSHSRYLPAYEIHAFSKPQENTEYIIDTKYPGYLLSSESRTVSRDQVRREHPEYLEDGGWSAATSYASLKELRMTRGIKPAHVASSGSASVIKNEETKLERPTAFLNRNEIDIEKLADMVTKNSQKKLVILINEGTGKSHYRFWITQTVVYECV